MYIALGVFCSHVYHTYPEVWCDPEISDSRESLAAAPPAGLLMLSALPLAHRVPLSLSNRLSLCFSGTIAEIVRRCWSQREGGIWKERLSDGVTAPGKHHSCFPDTVTGWHCQNQLRFGWVFLYLAAGKTSMIFQVVVVMGCWCVGTSSVLLMWT